MPAEFGFLYNLWDFAADEGRLLERIVGEVGIDQVVVPLVTGPRTAFRPLVQPDAPHFHTDGGWHFRTSVKAYQSVTLRPRKARWFAAGDLLAQLRERTTASNLKLVARLDLRAVRPLVDDQPHVMQRNAWGQETPSAGACASNADLRELLRATFDDLARYALAGYELRDWTIDHAVDRAEPRPFDWSPRVRRLLDMCFCASCRQIAERANVDADQAARSVRVHVDRALAAGRDGAEPPSDAADPVLEAYTAARVADCAAWLKRLAESEPERRRLLVRESDDTSLGNCAPWVPMLRLPSRRIRATDEWWAQMEPELARAAAVSLPASRPLFGDSAALVQRVHALVNHGVTVIDVEGLTEAPADAVEWLRQAIRYARRT